MLCSPLGRVLVYGPAARASEPGRVKTLEVVFETETG
jgi:hypothetical protein